MDHKELRANAPLSIVNDDNTKYVHSSPTFSENKNKSYHEIGANSMGKMDATPVRPCAIIGPDRVHPPTPGDAYLKKTSVEPWPCPENIYRQPSDHPNKLLEYQPNRNISPRQTFQENMQRIMVPPTYSSVKNSDEASLNKNKLNMPLESKYCDVPYNMTSVNNEHKSARNSDIPLSSVNPAFSRSVPHYGWPAGVSIRPQRPYGTPEFYQYPEYPNCVGPRPATMSHQHRIHREEAQAYSERLYQEANIRFKPYPISKEKHQQARYDYNINNYSNTFHPPVSFPPYKFDLQKSVHNHPYPIYPQVPLKFLDRRVHESFVDGYQRSNQQVNFNTPFHKQMIHQPYGPVSANCVQNKPYPDLSPKPIAVNKLPYDTNNKIYLDLDNSRNKSYPTPENFYYNDMNQQMRSDILLPNHSTINMHSIPKHQFYRRENVPLKHYEYNPHYRNLDQSVNLNYSLTRLPLQYSPNSIAISPSDSNTSNDTTHTMGTSQEDCGYVSQSSTTSVRSLDTGNLSIPRDIYRMQDYTIHPISRKALHINGTEQISKNKMSSSNKKNINVRQFLQMWNEGEEEINESNKEAPQLQPSNFSSPTEASNSEEQLYVLGLVNVPNEELSKYEHIQKISKLPENIKGYNSIEILNQYEELLESPNMNKYKITPKFHKEHYNLPRRLSDKDNITVPRPVSPLDVEAKITQSVIHKEVGCNFEIKPCSPEMLNVEVATPIQSILGERIIEKVANPITAKSPMLSRNDNNNLNSENNKITSCDMVHKQYPVNNYSNIIRNNYTVQDFESNSGLCLASLPQLDNDIELNFPEINQQFIKANQMESEEQKSQEDLPQLNLHQINQNKNSFLNQNTLSPQLSLVSAPEKEFSKLSKYRKGKKIDLMPREDVQVENNVDIAQQRINSVIIKNPDTRLQEDNYVSFLTANKTSIENIINNDYGTEHSPDNIEYSATEEKRILSFETALDFSLSKIDETPSIEYINKSTNYFEDNISFPPKDILDKETIAETTLLDLHIQDSKQKIYEERVNFDKDTKYSNNELMGNSGISIPLKLLDNEVNESINKSVVENTSCVNQMDEYKIERETTSLIIAQKENSLSETLNKKFEGETEMNCNDKTLSVNDKSNKSNISCTKIIEFPEQIKTNETEINSENKLDEKAIYAETKLNEKEIDNETIIDIKEIDGENKRDKTEIYASIKLDEKEIDADIKSVKKERDKKAAIDRNEIESESKSDEKEIYMETNLDEKEKHADIKLNKNEIDAAIRSDNKKIDNKATTDENETDNESKSNEKEIYVKIKLDGKEKDANTKLNEKDIDSDFTSDKNEIDRATEIDRKEIYGESKIDEKEIYAETKSGNKIGKIETDCEIKIDKKEKDGKTTISEKEINGEFKSDKKKRNHETKIDKNIINGDSKIDKKIIIKMCGKETDGETKLGEKKTHEALQKFEFKSDKNEPEIGIITVKSKLEDEQKIDENQESGASGINKKETNEVTKIDECSDDAFNQKEDMRDYINCEEIELNNLFETNLNMAIDITKKTEILYEKVTCLFTDIKNNTENIQNKEMYNEIKIKECEKDNIDKNKELETTNIIEKNNKNSCIKRHEDAENTELKEVNMLEFKIDSYKIEKESTNEELRQLNNKNIPRLEDRREVNLKSADEIYEHIETVTDIKKSFFNECFERNVEVLPHDSNIVNNTYISEVDVELQNSIKELSENNQDVMSASKDLLLSIKSTKFSEDSEDIKTNENKDDKGLLSTENEIAPKDNIRKSIRSPSKHERNIYFRKKLYSPWIQKLFLFSEGVCDTQNENMQLIKEDISIVTGQTNNKEINKLNFTKGTDGLSKELTVVPKKIECCDKFTDLKLYSESNEEDFSKSTIEWLSITRRNPLKRSLSVSALEDYKEDINNKHLAPNKRKKNNHNIIQPIISEDLCNMIQSNRRNSISTLYNENNVYILIDNDFIITEENDDSAKIYYTEVSDECGPNALQNDSAIFGPNSTIINEPTVDDLIRENSNSLHETEVEPVPETWVEDVACIETVVSDDITEDINEVMSPRKYNLDGDTCIEKSVIYCDTKHLDKIKNIYGSNMCSSDTQILQTLYMTPQMNVNKTLSDIESHNTIDQQENNKCVDNSIAKQCNDFLDKLENEILSYSNSDIINEKENISEEDTEYTKVQKNEFVVGNNSFLTSEKNEDREESVVDSCKSNNDYFSHSPKRTDSNYSNSSSPEVSSTTSEEKNSTILLKITNYNGSRVSKVNEIAGDVIDRISYKLTEKNDYQNYNCNFKASRTLITKAAQKYIPPLKETVGDLKVKLTLPQHRLRSLKQLKISKVKPKIEEKIIKLVDKKGKQNIPKKQKPKFEDVLKSIDEIQFKKHKDKIKKGKNVIPKVVIKKNENGAHYASSKTTNNKESYNPDLTGRKWQPWVFLEKNSFIDKMAIRKKVKAIYCHRRNNYVLADKFRKYKSIYNANFVITQPSSDSSAKGNLKYTIRLKHK